MMDLALASTRDRPHPCFETRHVSTLVSFVESGLGVAAVPRLSMPRKGHPSLVSVPIVEPEVTRTVGLIKRRGRSLSPAAEHLYAMLRAVAHKQMAAGKDSTPAQRAGSTELPPAGRGGRTRSRRTADVR
jgi:DNA-binding transcriptional LysR family regulator